jgi:hypothetical protein
MEAVNRTRDKQRIPVANDGMRASIGVKKEG